MLDAVKPLLFNGGNQPAVYYQRRRGVAVEGVNAENVQTRCSASGAAANVGGVSDADFDVDSFRSGPSATESPPQAGIVL